VEKCFSATRRQLRRTNPNANADVESFHKLVEVEFFDLEHFNSRADFWQKVATYQNWFNLTRKSSCKGWRSPCQILSKAAPRRGATGLLAPSCQSGYPGRPRALAGGERPGGST